MVHVAVERVGQQGACGLGFRGGPLIPRPSTPSLGSKGRADLEIHLPEMPSVSSGLTKCYRGFNTSDSEPTNLDDV